MLYSPRAGRRPRGRVIGLVTGRGPSSGVVARVAVLDEVAAAELVDDRGKLRVGPDGEAPASLSRGEALAVRPGRVVRQVKPGHRLGDVVAERRVPAQHGERVEEALEQAVALVLEEGDLLVGQRPVHLLRARVAGGKHRRGVIGSDVQHGMPMQRMPMRTSSSGTGLLVSAASMEASSSHRRRSSSSRNDIWLECDRCCRAFKAGACWSRHGYGPRPPQKLADDKKGGDRSI